MRKIVILFTLSGSEKIKPPNKSEKDKKIRSEKSKKDFELSKRPRGGGG